MSAPGLPTSPGVYLYLMPFGFSRVRHAFWDIVWPSVYQHSASRRHPTVGGPYRQGTAAVVTRSLGPGRLTRSKEEPLTNLFVHNPTQRLVLIRPVAGSSDCPCRIQKDVEVRHGSASQPAPPIVALYAGRVLSEVGRTLDCSLRRQRSLEMSQAMYAVEGCANMQVVLMPPQILCDTRHTSFIIVMSTSTQQENARYHGSQILV